MKIFNQFKLTTLFLAILLPVSLSGCGLKGDLYQTPEQESVPPSTVEKQASQ